VFGIKVRGDYKEKNLPAVSANVVISNKSDVIEMLVEREPLINTSLHKLMPCTFVQIPLK